MKISGPGFLITAILITGALFYQGNQTKPSAHQSQKGEVPKKIFTSSATFTTPSEAEGSPKTTVAVTQDPIPWTELVDEWNQEIELTLVQQGLETNNDVLRSYREEKRAYFDDVHKLVAELETTYAFDLKQETVSFVDRRKFRRLQKELDRLEKAHGEKTKVIFGEHYEVVKLKYRSFRKSAQAFNSGEGSIGIDGAFE